MKLAKEVALVTVIRQGLVRISVMLLSIVSTVVRGFSPVSLSGGQFILK
jgi:hypothetical protein